MNLYGKPTGHVHFRPNLMMAPPRIYWWINAQDKSSPSPLPSWREMYLSQPPVAIAMLMVAYHGTAPPGSRNIFKVMIRDNDGITLGLVYETLAATMPAYDESVGASGESDSVAADVCWYETVIDGGGDEHSGEKGTDDDGSEDESSGEDSSGDQSGGEEDGGDEGSVIYDSDGNVMGDSSASMEDSSSEVYEYAEHESELGSDTGFEAEDNEQLIESQLRTTEEF